MFAGTTVEGRLTVEESLIQGEKNYVGATGAVEKHYRLVSIMPCHDKGHGLAAGDRLEFVKVCK